MKLKDLLLIMPSSTIVSVERPDNDDQPLALGEMPNILHSRFAECEVAKFYPERYKGLFCNGITVKVKGV